MSVSLSTKYQSITLYLFIILSACTSAFVPDTLAQEVLWSPAGFDAPPKVGAFDNTHERFHGGARELFQDEGVHGTVSAPKGNSALPQEEEAASSPKSSANDITVDQFTDEESALDGKLHVFAKLVERHIENTRAMCKDPEDKKTWEPSKCTWTQSIDRCRKRHDANGKCCPSCKDFCREG